MHGTAIGIRLTDRVYGDFTGGMERAVIMGAQNIFDGTAGAGLAIRINRCGNMEGALFLFDDKRIGLYAEFGFEVYNRSGHGHTLWVLRLEIKG
jgi:hypothetical protein